MNRDALDRWITGNYGEDQFKQFEYEADELFEDMLDAIRYFCRHYLGDEPNDVQIAEETAYRVANQVREEMKEFI